MRELADAAIGRGYRLRLRRRLQIAIPAAVVAALAIGIVVPAALRSLQFGDIAPTGPGRRGAETTPAPERSKSESAKRGLSGGGLGLPNVPGIGDAPVGGGTTESSTKRIAYVSAADGDAEIYTMDRDGTDRRRLTDNAYTDEYPSWSPDGSRLVFASNRSGSNAIYMMRSDGAGVRRIGTGGNSEASHPAWSPDGRRIAFAGFETNMATGRSQIWSMDIDGSDASQVSPVFGTAERPGRAIFPAWSPDGERIAYTNIYNGHKVHAIDADGSDLSILENGHSPAWSPDGKYIAFVNVDDYGDWSPQSLVIMDVEGTPLRSLSTTDEDWYGRPAWSPDGSFIVFDRDADGHWPGFACDASVSVTPGGASGPRCTLGSGPEKSSLWVIGTDATGLRRLPEASDDYDAAFQR